MRYHPVVAGQALLPVTLDTYNVLVAWENPFVCGGSCDFTALFQFIWAHHPDFGQFNPAGRRRVLRAVLRALAPRHPVRNIVCRTLAPLGWRFLSRWCEPTPAELEQAAIEECQRLVTEAIGQFPVERSSASDTAPSEPLPFSLQAQVLGLMRRELGVPFAETRALPLKELSQHLREVSWVASKGRAMLHSPEEARVWTDYLDWKDRQAAKNQQSEIKN